MFYTITESLNNNAIICRICQSYYSIIISTFGNCNKAYWSRQNISWINKSLAQYISK